MVGSQQTGDGNIADLSVVTVIDGGSKVIRTSKKDGKLNFYLKYYNPEIVTVKKTNYKVESKNFKITCEPLCSSG